MKLRRLEISGFKSFADRVVFSFDDGVTGVVGPNGCGKSNVVDAIRWAMGEQSAKHLRGRAMEDVIFSGSESRPATGMAEVSLTFQNDGQLVPPQYAGFGEITVTRRLFRNGDSDYEINKTACRLLDITELFLGTGVGTRAYSIIEQGRIGLIVSAKPEDRRSIIEEAAGVTKYKARRKQAERKLEATEQNLLRLGDVVAEVRARLSSLERSAKKAEAEAKPPEPKKPEAKPSPTPAATDRGQEGGTAAAPSPGATLAKAGAAAAGGAGAGAGATAGAGAGQGGQADYYYTYLQGRIYAAWQRPLYPATETLRKSLTTTVRLTLSSSGRVTRAELVSSSGYGAIDQSVLRAVQDAQPFQPIPSSLGRESLTVNLEITLTPN